ncbi:MAG: SDR family oxidoreductase [Anaerolineales bacterium]|nr:SDR family oxidoreductase [Anaerolineales bacterium]
MKDLENLDGKTALVTGASSGLGADFARQLAAMGCRVILVARRAEKLQALKIEIFERHSVQAETVAMDLSAPGAPQKLFDQLTAKSLPVDILINNAGYALFGEFIQAEWERCRAMLELDVMALTHLTRLFAADMVRRKSGWILHVASTGAFQPTPLYAAYAAAKSYVLYFGEALHHELRQHGVNVTVLCPGVTRTEFFGVAGQEMTAFQRLTAMDSADVARIGLRAMLRKRSCVVAGPVNAAVAALAPLLPRQFMADMAARMMR